MASISQAPKNYGLAVSLGISGDLIGDTEYGEKPASSKTWANSATSSTAPLMSMWQTDIGEFQFSYAKDVSNRHDGDSIAIEYSKMFQQRKLVLRPQC